MTEDKQEIRLNEQIARGVQAMAVLSNPVYQETFTVLRAHLFQKFEAANAGELAEIQRRLQTINEIEHQLAKVMQTGNAAQRTLIERIAAVGTAVGRRIRRAN